MKVNKNILSYSIGLNNDEIDVDIFCGKSKIGVILVPPDPNWGGNKNQPLIDALFWNFVEKDVSVMRFSFTKYPIINHNYVRYVAQTSICVEEFIETAKLPEEFYIIGYSFGAIIALNMLLRRPEFKAGILISPPIGYYNTLSWLSTYKTTVTMIFGDIDPLTQIHLYEEYDTILKNNKMNVSSVKIYQADHYFTGKIPNLVSVVNKNIFHE